MHFALLVMYAVVTPPFVCARTVLYFTEDKPHGAVVVTVC